MRQTRNTKLVQIGQIREIYGLFFFIFIFFFGLAYWSDPSADFDAQ